MRRSGRWRKAVVVALVAALLALSTSGQTWLDSAEPAVAAGTTCVGGDQDSCLTNSVAAFQGTAEEQLAAKYAPIMMLRVPPDACAREAYQPAPVEVVLGNPRIRFDQFGPDGRGERSVKNGPTAADLYQARDDKRAYIDLPGQPGNAGCTYVRDFKEFGAGTPAVTYAHIAREKGYLALQYWFYYYFNDWNNQHESDWEMIQLLFRADSAEQALGQEPVRVAYAQHGGGEKVNWNDRRLQREGDHPIVYASAGSHASYFEPEVFLGLGERGSGLGCDYADGPHRRVPLEPRLVPATLRGADDPFAWSVFPGQWGEKQSGQNNGPTGPNAKPRWRTPVTDFDEDIRDNNVTVPRSSTLGPNAVDFFCGLAEQSGRVLGLYYQSPLLVGLTGGAMALAVVAFGVVVGRSAFFTASGRARRGRPLTASTEPRAVIGRKSAFRHYIEHWPIFIGIGAIFIPIGLVGSLLNRELTFGGLVIGLPLIGGLPLLVAFVVVNAAVAAVLAEIGAGRQPGVLHGYKAVRAHFGPLLWARLKTGLIVALLIVSIIGIPWAVMRLVSWLFLEQAIVIEGANSRTAPAISAAAVRGHWWRTAATALLLGAVGALTGPVLGVAILLLLRWPGEMVNLVSSVVYALLLPLIFIALTQLYCSLTASSAIKEPDEEPEV